MYVVYVLMMFVAITAGQQFTVRRPFNQPLRPGQPRPSSLSQQQLRRQQFSGPPQQGFGPRQPPPGQRRPPNTFFRNPSANAPVRRPVAAAPPRSQIFASQRRPVAPPPPLNSDNSPFDFRAQGNDFEHDFQAHGNDFESERPEPASTEFEPFPIPNHLGGIGDLPLNPRPEFNNPSFEPSESPASPGEDIVLDDSDFITIGSNSGGLPTPPEGFLSEDPQLKLQGKSSPEPLSTSTEPVESPKIDITETVTISSSDPPTTSSTTTTTTKMTTTTTSTTPVPIIRQTQYQQQHQEVLVAVPRPQRKSPPAPQPFNNNFAPTAPHQQPSPPRRQFRPNPLESNDIHGFVDSVPRQEAQEAREQLLRLGEYQDPQPRQDYYYEDNADYDIEAESEEDKPDRLALLLLNSTFTCMGMKGGYYADEQVQCEVFHYCQDNIKHSWLCPEGASFHQVHLICMPRTEDNICEKSSNFHFVNDFLYKELETESGISSSKNYADRYYPEGFEEGLAHLEGFEGQKSQSRPPLSHSGQQQQQREPTGVVFHNADEVDIPFVARHPPHPFDELRLPHNQPSRFADHHDFASKRRQQG